MRDQNFSARVSGEFLLDLDALRKLEADLPSKTEMLHRLVSRAVDEMEDQFNPVSVPEVRRIAEADDGALEGDL